MTVVTVISGRPVSSRTLASTRRKFGFGVGRVTSVPEPEKAEDYVESALAARAEGSRLHYAVIEEASNSTRTFPGFKTRGIEVQLPRLRFSDES